MRQLVIFTFTFLYSIFLFCQESSKEWENYSEEQLYFLNSKDTIYGNLIIPKESKNEFPVVVFVHGSGPEDYSSSDNYRYLWDEFTRVGFACFSWDRPGVGRSQGNWFEKSIEDRKLEVINAIQMLKQHPKVNPDHIGFWGISQAGWVIPKVTEVISPAFIISVSAPVTTAFDQELYRLRSELAMEGFSNTAIDSAISYTENVRNLIIEGKSFSDFDLIQQGIKSYDWSSSVIAGGEEIYQYLKVIIEGDHVPDLSNLNCPILAIWGENDLLVPPRSSAQRYKEVMRQLGNKHAKIVIVPHADHTLTYNKSGRREETVERREKYRNKPDKIFAPGYLKSMSKWLKNLDF